MLKKIRKKTINDLVFLQLKKAILDGTFQPGDKLPSENELCGELGVSRPSVKIAIQRLCTLGIVETRAGDGSYVTQFNPSVLFDQVADFIVSRDNIREVAEFRMHMEIMCAQMAMNNATEEDFAKMDSILADMDRTLAVGDADRHARLDYLLHVTIARASRNKILLSMYEMMENVNMQYIILENREFFAAYGKTEFHDVHREIVESIKARDIRWCTEIYTGKYTL